jgi:hypothetical protein
VSPDLFRSLLWIAILLQFAWLGYDPIAQIPTQADRAAGDALVAELRAAPGRVMIPFHNYLSLFAGRESYFHMVAYQELRGDFSQVQYPAYKELVQEMRYAVPDLLIMDFPNTMVWEWDCFNGQQITYVSDKTFISITGYNVRPIVRYVRIPDCP